MPGFKLIINGLPPPCNPPPISDSPTSSIELSFLKKSSTFLGILKLDMKPFIPKS